MTRTGEIILNQSTDIENIEKKLKELPSVFNVTIAIVVLIFSFGGWKFVAENIIHTIYISIGMATLIGVFLGFYYTGKLKILSDKFTEKIELVETNIRDRITPNMLSDEYRKIANEIVNVEVLRKRINLPRSMYIALMAYILTVLISFLTFYPTKGLDIIYFIVAILFYIGFCFTLFVVVSLIAMHFIGEP